MAEDKKKPTKKAVKTAVNDEITAPVPVKTAEKAKKPSAKSIIKPAANPVSTAKKAKQTKKKTTSKKSPKAKRPTKAEEIKILERRYLVWDLYKAGASFRMIAEHLKTKNEKHCSLGTVHADLQYCLALQHNELELDVKDHVANEVAVIHDVRLAFSPTMKDTKMPMDIRLNAGNMVINTVKEKARLLNLYKPPKIMLSPDDELAKILGISTDQLPDVNSSED